MDPVYGVPAALCITGMHRSGTSLVSSLLQSGGLDIGQRLLGAGAGNLKGHFEDVDFLNLHIRILKARGISSTGFTLQDRIPVDAEQVACAEKLIAQRRQHGVPWAWKDPRATLFLDFWGELLPEAHFLFLYRSPWEVVDSFTRRGDKMFRANPDLAVLIWCHYNRLLVDFHDRFPGRCICISSHQVGQEPGLLRQVLLQKFGLKLKPFAELYDPSLLHHLESSSASRLERTCPEALAIYEQLNVRASGTLTNDCSHLAEPVSMYQDE